MLDLLTSAFRRHLDTADSDAVLSDRALSAIQTNLAGCTRGIYTLFGHHQPSYSSGQRLCIPIPLIFAPDGRRVFKYYRLTLSVNQTLSRQNAKYLGFYSGINFILINFRLLAKFETCRRLAVCFSDV